MKMKKLLVGHTESDKYFVRIRSTKPLPEARAYPVLPMDKSECIIRLQRLAKHYAHLPILHDGLCGTSDTHQLCIKLIIEAINPKENTDTYGNDELLEFYNNELQFITSRHALSKAMIANNDDRTVDALLDDYHYNHEDETDYVFNILSDADIYAIRYLKSKQTKQADKKHCNENSKNLKKYYVTMAVNGRITLEVSATDFEDAKQKACNENCNTDFGQLECIDWHAVNAEDETGKTTDY